MMIRTAELPATRSARFKRHLGALMWKNTLLKRRAPFETMCELFMGIAAVGLLAYGRTVSYHKTDEARIGIHTEADPYTLQTDSSQLTMLPSCTHMHRDCFLKVVSSECDLVTQETKGIGWDCEMWADGKSLMSKPAVRIACDATFEDPRSGDQYRCLRYGHDEQPSLETMYWCHLDEAKLKSSDRDDAAAGGRRLGGPGSLPIGPFVGQLLTRMAPNTNPWLSEIKGEFVIVPKGGGAEEFITWLHHTRHPWARNAVPKSREELEKTVKDSEYPRVDFQAMTSNYVCGAVDFTTAPWSADVQYSVRLNQTLQSKSDDPMLKVLAKIMAGDNIDTSFGMTKKVGGFGSPGDRNGGLDNSGNSWYSQSGFLALQRSVDTFIGEDISEGWTPDQDKIYGHATFLSGEDGREHLTVPMPTQQGQHDPFKEMMPEFFGTLLLVCVSVSNRLIFMVVNEREQRLSEVMRMMGMSGSAFYFSWILTYVAISTVGSFGMTFLLSYYEVLPVSSPSVIFLFFFFTGTALIAFSLMLSTWFVKAKSAAMIGCVIYFASSSLGYLLRAPSDRTFWRTHLLGLLPTVNLQLVAGIIAEREVLGEGVTWGNFMIDDLGFSVFSGISMMVFDTVFWFVIFAYLDQVLPRTIGVQRPWYFPLQESYWASVFHGGMRRTPSEQRCFHEDFAHDGNASIEQVTGEHAQAMVQNGQVVLLQRLSKRFGDFWAVKNLDLTMYTGEIFALLGHNGAGKTTTMSMLCGLMPPSSGRCVAFGHDIEEEPEELKNRLGVCPQHDVLWDTLTCREHLEMFCIFKGVKEEHMSAEVEKMLDRVGLTSTGADVRPAGALSGGMKRKLSMGIAFIGHSSLVILDEPSSGLDPYSRRMVWELLRSMKQNRVTILSTHYMDEADVLGDRIAIMHEGQLKCCGSPKFLKQTYECGYNVTIVKRPGCNSERVFDAVCAQMPELVTEVAPQTDSANEFVIQFPFAASTFFPKILSHLQNNLDNLCIESFGVSVTTLEEVFFKVASGEVVNRSLSFPFAAAGGDMQHYQEMHDVTGTGQARDMSQLPFIDIENVGRDQQERAPKRRFAASSLCGTLLNLRHFQAMLKKRVKYGVRDRRGILCQVFLPVLAMIGMLAVVAQGLAGSQPPLKLDATTLNTHCPAEIKNTVDFSHLPYVSKEDASKVVDSGKSFWRGDTTYWPPSVKSDEQMNAFDDTAENMIPGLQMHWNVLDEIFDKVAEKEDLINKLQQSNDPLLTFLGDDQQPSPDDSLGFLGDSQDSSIDDSLGDDNQRRLQVGEGDDVPVVAPPSGMNQGVQMHNLVKDHFKDMLAKLIPQTVAAGSQAQDQRLMPTLEARVEVLSQYFAGRGEEMRKQYQSNPYGLETEDMIWRYLRELIDHSRNGQDERTPEDADADQRCITSKGISSHDLEQLLQQTFHDQESSEWLKKGYDKAHEELEANGKGDVDVAPAVKQATETYIKVFVSEFYRNFNKNLDGCLSEEDFMAVAGIVRQEIQRRVAILDAFATDLTTKQPACSRYGAFFVLSGEKNPEAVEMLESGAATVIFANTSSPHAAPTFQAAWTNADFKTRGIEKTVMPTNHPFPFTEHQKQGLEMVFMMSFCTFIVISMSFIPAGISQFLVKERVSGAQQLQILCGCSRTVYWTANFVYDLGLYCVPALAMPLVMYQYDLTMMLQGENGWCFFFLLVALGPALVGISYVTSFFFQDHAKASNAVLIYCLLGSGVLNVVITILFALNFMSDPQHPSDCDPSLKVGDEKACRFPAAKVAYDIIWPLAMIMIPTVGLFQGVMGISWHEQMLQFFGKKIVEQMGSEHGIDTSLYSNSFAGAALRYMIIQGVLFYVLSIVIDTLTTSVRMKRWCDVQAWKDFFSGRRKRNIQFDAESVNRPFVGVGANDGDLDSDSSVFDEAAVTEHTSPRDVALHVLNLGKTYGSLCSSTPKHAVKGISFRIDYGEVFGLLGHNGAGKTSALKCFVGQEPCSFGQVHVGGIDMETQSSTARRNVGYCPQFDALLDNLTVRDHLELYARLKGLPKTAVSEAICVFKLSKIARRRADVLSGGNKRKLSAAVALIGHPTLAILDEPSCGLDPGARRGLWGAVEAAVKGSSRNGGTTAVLLTTHAMEEAEALSNRLGIMAEGRMLTIGTCQQIKQRSGASHELSISTVPESLEALRAGLLELEQHLFPEACGACGPDGQRRTLLAPSTPLSFEALAPWLQATPQLAEAYGRQRCVVRAQIEALGHVEAQVLVEWYLQQRRGISIKKFLCVAVGDSVELAENFGQYWRFSLPRGNLRLADLFARVEESLERLGIAEYTLSQATLEQIFNSIAGEQMH